MQRAIFLLFKLPVTSVTYCNWFKCCLLFCCSVYMLFLFSLPPTQWLIVTLALYALLLTINGLSVFLNDWASRGNVERIGLLQSVNAVSGNKCLPHVSLQCGLSCMHSCFYLLLIQFIIITVYTPCMHTQAGTVVPIETTTCESGVDCLFCELDRASTLQ